MEGARLELDKDNAEMEKLKAKFQNKADLLDSLKIAYNEQLNKHQESKVLIEKQTKELNAKSTEIYETRELNEVLKSRLQEKESIVRQLSTIYERLQVDCFEKVKNLEGENKRLQLSLDEAITRNNDFEQKIRAFTDENGALKRLLSDAEKKCLEAEEMVRTSKELKFRHETIEDLEEKYQNVQDQLKWKKEQFKHLEEAHKKLQVQFSSSKDEWESEKSALLEGISSLQTNLDSQARISEGLQTQLTMCNQALAHEESKRKYLEVQVLESQSRFEDVHVKCEEAQSKIESLMVDRDEDVANLRNLLGTKDVPFKEMEFKITYLQQENRDLHASLKELQESQINNAGAAFSVEKLRKNLLSVEHIHSSCPKVLKQKESEWSTQIAKMDEEMRNYLAQLDVKESQILQLQEDLIEHESSLELLREEMAVVLIVQKSELAEAYSKLLVDIKQKSNKLALQMKTVELEVPQMEEELKRHKILLDESSETQHKFEAQISQMGNVLKDLSIDIESVNSEFNKKVSENCLLEFEMHKWKSFAECEQASLDENQDTQKQVENALLSCVKNKQALKKENESLSSIVKEQEMMISNLREKVSSQETTSETRSEEVEMFKQATYNQLRITQENESTIENLQTEIAELELESITRELEGIILARTNAERNFDNEKTMFLEIIKEKDRTIEGLQLRTVLLDEEFTHNLILSFAEVTEKLVVLQALDEANHLRKVEIQEKTKTIAQIENKLHEMQKKSEFQEDLMYTSKQHTKQLENILETKTAEIEKLKDRFGNEHRALEGATKELNFEKRTLLEDLMKLSLEKEYFLAQLNQDCDRMNELCCDDAKMMGMLTNILQTPKDNGMDQNFMVNNEHVNLTEENAREGLFPLMKKAEERSALREINN